MNIMDTAKIIRFWKDSAEKDLKVAQDLLRLKHYPQCLFFGHLCLEKMLKAIIVKRSKTHALPIHDLVRLAKMADLALSEGIEQDFNTISKFNVAARYQEEKYKMYKLASAAYAQKYLKLIEKYYLWLKQEFQKTSK